MKDEFSFISQYLAPLTKDFKEAKGLADDAAVFSFDKKNKKLVISVDNFIVGLHCPVDISISDACTRAILVAASDLVAIGATPYCMFISLSIPKTFKKEFFSELQAGISKGIKLSNLDLAGGDTVVYSGPLALSITVLGHILEGSEINRNGAKPGDILLISGNIGDGNIGLESLQKRYNHLSVKEKFYVQEKFLRPIPKYDLAIKLKDILNASIDISDGLIADVSHIAKASSCGIEINSSWIPISSIAQKFVKYNIKTIEDLVCAGDDYEIAMAIDKNNVNKALSIAKSLNYKLSVVGKFIIGDNVLLDKKKVKYGFNHLRNL